MRGRVTLVVAVCVLGAVTLGGCQRDPSVAARVDGQVLTEAQVETLFAEALQGVPVPAAGSDQRSPITRQDVVVTFVLGHACQKQRAAQQFKVDAITAEQYAQAAGVSPTSQYAKDRADMIACVTGAVNVNPSPTPTTDELQQVFKAAQDAGVVPEGLTFDAARDSLAGSQSVRQSVAYKRTVDQMVAGVGVEVSPRYAPIELPWQSLQQVPPGLFSRFGPAASDAIKH